MRLDELDYNLPDHLIAQEPLSRREQARMIVVRRRSGAFEHSRFYKIGDHLEAGDLLVINDTRVLPGRLLTCKESGGKVEILLIRPCENRSGGWIALTRSRRPLRVGARLLVEGRPALKVVGYDRPGRPIIESVDGVPVDKVIERYGRLPLPHYIRREVRLDDEQSYQTVYARNPGAVAAPTAGLHFDHPLMDELTERGVRFAALTLHIGPGTFVPVRVREVERHTMEAEWYRIPPATVEAIEHTRRICGRVVAVGTSVVRALESWAITGEPEGWSGLFIHPGFRFKLVDAMLTNFHMPRTTVLALVMALVGRNLLLRAYRDAIRHRYRFLSYGDAMLIL